jgi:hypothetical protein
MPSKAVQFDLRMVARSHTQEGLDLILKCMRECGDWNTRLKAIELLFAYGHGKPQVAEVNVCHQFVVAPQTMQIDEWLERRGQPKPNEWLEKQKAKTETVGVARHPKRALPTLDLKAEERPEPKPPVDPSKLS